MPGGEPSDVARDAAKAQLGQETQDSQNQVSFPYVAGILKVLFKNLMVVMFQII